MKTERTIVKADPGWQVLVWNPGEDVCYYDIIAWEINRCDNECPPYDPRCLVIPILCTCGVHDLDAYWCVKTPSGKFDMDLQVMDSAEQVVAWWETRIQQMQAIEEKRDVKQVTH